MVFLFAKFLYDSPRMHKHLYQPHAFNTTLPLISVQFIIPFEAASQLTGLPLYPDTDCDVYHSLMLCRIFIFRHLFCFFISECGQAKPGVRGEYLSGVIGNLGRSTC